MRSTVAEYRILAIIVDGEPNTGDDRECFPPRLRKCEPIAADARPVGDGKTNAKLKLLAGMLGVSFDALKQRDSHRRMRRLQIALVFSLLIASAFAALSWYANQQRTVALERTVRLRDVVSRLLWKLHDAVDYLPGGLKTRKSFLTARHYISELAAEEKANAGLERDMEVTYSRIGKVRIEQGKLAEAKTYFERSLPIAERLATRDAE